MNTKINKFPKFSECNTFQILCFKYRMNRLINLLSDNSQKSTFQLLKQRTLKKKPILPHKLTFVESGREERIVIKRSVIRNENLQAFSRRSYQILKDKPVDEFKSTGSFVEPIRRTLKVQKSISILLKEQSFIQYVETKTQQIQPYNNQLIEKQNLTRMMKQQQEFDRNWEKVLIRLLINTALITTIIIIIVSYLLQ